MTQSIKQANLTTGSSPGRPGSPQARASGYVSARLRVWLGISKQTLAGAGAHNISLIASGVGFYALLAIFPALGVFVSLYGLIANPSAVGQEISAIAGIFPTEAIDLLQTQLQSLISAPRGSLSVGLCISILLALFSARSGASALMEALNIAYGVGEKRGFIMQNLVAIALTLGILLFLVVALALVAVVPAVLDLLWMTDGIRWLASLIRWPILAVLFMSGLACAYRFAPCRPATNWTAIGPGAAVATALWIAASGLFSLYVSEFGSYDKTYGSLGAVVILLMWFYISALTILIGAELNAAVERHIQDEAIRQRRNSGPVSVRGL